MQKISVRIWKNLEAIFYKKNVRKEDVQPEEEINKSRHNDSHQRFKNFQFSFEREISVDYEKTFQVTLQKPFLITSNPTLELK